MELLHSLGREFRSGAVTLDLGTMNPRLMAIESAAAAVHTAA
ncbi:hypothetical protein [Nocardia beijingensis]|uniref:Uncharacterized protein n=1 Tax=Nocardia beijingensis TaxID=95162 RepID=A0ABW7WBW0_9NOCA